MPVTYDDFLDAAIRHLEMLKTRGAKYVDVSPESLRELSKPLLQSPIRAADNIPAQVRGGGRPPGNPGEPQPPIPKPREAPIPSAAISPGEIRPEVLPLSLPADPKKVAAFAALRERVSVCVKCANLASSRKNIVFGVGNFDAQLMFVGEAPGADEDAQGEPFVGRAGELLTKIIQAMGLQRSHVYIANILKCRPDTPGQTSGNRKPTADEMATCIPYLHEQIDLIRPRVLVALGGTAIEGLLGKTDPVGKVRGQWQTYRGTPLMPTFHPSYLLRNQAMSEKRKVWEDMLSVMEKLEMPISDKQRHFFKSNTRAP